jgi:hypothetical protein
MKMDPGCGIGTASRRPSGAITTDLRGGGILAPAGARRARLLIGLPLGIAAGRAAWGLFADDLGFVAVAAVVAWGLVALAAGTIAVANLLAAGPAIAAARTRPASLLRAE